MKKLLVLCLSVLWGTPLLASGIDMGASNVSCDETTLETYGGTTDMEIEWEPNTINLNWWNGDEQVAGQATCTYDGIINVPTQPTRPGYTFNGWKVDRSCGLKHVDPNINATGRCYRDPDGGRNCFLGANYNLTENGTWAVVFNYGTVLGDVLCSITSGSDGRLGKPNTDTVGDYCWCRIIGYIGSDGGMCSTASGWLRESIADTNTSCVSVCAARCAYRIHSNAGRRTTLYNSLPQ